MQVYLPIAEMAVNAEAIFLLSAGVGILSGIFGIGGGFLTTPFLIFMGIPPAVAVGTQSAQLLASSVAGALGHWHKGNVDIRMGMMMVAGGLAGSFIGTFLFALLERTGQIDFTIYFLYIVLLGGMGFLMLYESATAFFGRRNPVTPREAQETRMGSDFIARLPYKIRFARSRLYISALVPAGIGFVGGMLTSVLGIGGGFILVPAMIYILGMPGLLVSGTSLLQMMFTAAAATLMHAIANQSVDIMLAVILIIGGVIGAQIGVSFSKYIKGSLARVILALILLAVSFQMIGQLFIQPAELYSTVVWS
jgi:uncharacterized membrane protein YfcA